MSERLREDLLRANARLLDAAARLLETLARIDSIELKDSSTPVHEPVTDEDPAA